MEFSFGKPLFVCQIQDKFILSSQIADLYGLYESWHAVSENWRDFNLFSHQVSLTAV